MEKEFKSKFITRSLTGLGIVLPLVTLIYLENLYFFYTATAAITLLAIYEWRANSQDKGFTLDIISILTFLAFFLAFSSKFLFLYTLGISILWIFFTLCLISNKLDKFKNISFNNTFLRSALPMGFFASSIFLVNHDAFFAVSNFYLFLIIVFNSAISDSSAYLIGSALGKTPLLKNISPNKTVEGFIGGVIGAGLFGIILSFLLNMNLLIIPLLIIGSFFSFAGDYFFSFLKRQSGVKDTGSILPGHGGILDRIDSHLPSMPILVVLISYLA